MLFNFGEPFRQWIKLFTSDIKSCVQINGMISSWFPVGRGCRQGDPISPYLFLLCSEILAHIIRKDPDIKGYSLNDIEIKVSQFADDTSLFLDGSREALQKCFSVLLKFSTFSGLKMNLDKTKCIWFGCVRPPENIVLHEVNIEWNPEKFTVLGVEFTTDLKQITKINLKKKIESIQRELYQWTKRNLTPIGKITVIRSLMLAKIVHILIALPDPDMPEIKKLETLFYKFLWNKKPDKIKREIIVQKLEDGGLNMPDVNQFIKSLKISWIRRFHQSNATWRLILIQDLPLFDRTLQCGPEFLLKLRSDTRNKFWQDVLTSTHTFARKMKGDTYEQFLSTSFLFNEDVKINRETIKLNVFLENNVTFVHQLKNGKRFCTYREFQERYNLRIDYLTYFSVISSLRKREKMVEHNSKDENYTEAQVYFKPIIQTKEGSSKFYRVLTQKSGIPKGVAKWEMLKDNPDWKQVFLKLKATTTDPRLIWLQYRIIHNILTTNKSVSKFKHDQSEKCSFCGIQSESIVHLFGECNIIMVFWNELQQIINSRCNVTEQLALNNSSILLGLDPTQTQNKVIDQIILFAKQYIYNCKVFKRDIKVRAFLSILLNKYKVECILSHNAKDQINFMSNWEPYANLFRGLTS